MNIRKLLGFQEYQVEIRWEKSGEKQVVFIKARNDVHAIIKISKKYDVVGKARMVVKEMKTKRSKNI
ncbi:hypothetical protein D5F11_008975 [Siminovitchia terrae]|uniref:Uncharacterized protein n=1 Tax=Siminovitchia terrae TaxID=1914933 RepID=A0A429X9Z0_SIMTE|nr:hypothetical protein [Siminovitchia terrae]RST60179.1 hypothetical protein D5F11_008975 [Siminovitchia terrae]